MIAQANVTHIVIGKDDDLATSSETRDDLIAGQIGVFLVGSTVAKTTALSSGQRFQIVYKRNDGEIVESPVIDYSNIISKSTTAYTAPTEMSKAIGFNGTTGAIETSNSDDYVLHYKWDDTSASMGRGKPTRFMAYRSDASATQIEIAQGLVQNLIKNSSREPSVVIRAKVVVNHAGTASLSATTGNLTAVQDSKYVTAATDANGELSVGDFVRLGTVAGAAVTDDTYEVISFPSGGQYIELDRPFQGASATYTSTNCDYIAAATAASADCGIIFTAQALPFNVKTGKYEKVFFTFWLKSDAFGDTPETVLAYASKGKGSYYEIAEVEYFLRGNRGEPNRVAAYPLDYTADATSTKTYDQIVVTYKDTNALSIDKEVASYGTILIATEDESASTVNTDLQTVLGI